MTALEVDFEQHRAHLESVAYRMLGSLADAQDAVQETWLRLARSDVSEVQNLGGWLTRVVSRISLDLLRTRRSHDDLRLEDLDELPPGTAVQDSGPEDEAVLLDALGPALMAVLDRLGPAERLALVLHDVFAVPFAEIGVIMDRSPDAAKMLASRARRRVRGLEPPDAGPVPDARQRAVVAAFLQAARGGDLQALVRVLDPDIVLRVDQGRGEPVVVLGAAAVAARAAAYGSLARLTRLALLDGQVGTAAVRDGAIVSASRLWFSSAGISRMEIVSDALALAGLDVVLLEDPAR